MMTTRRRSRSPAGLHVLVTGALALEQWRRVLDVNLPASSACGASARCCDSTWPSTASTGEHAYVVFTSADTRAIHTVQRYAPPVYGLAMRGLSRYVERSIRSSA